MLEGFNSMHAMNVAPLAEPYEPLLRTLSNDPEVLIRGNVPLREISRWRIGGPCDVLLEPTTKDGFGRALQALQQIPAPVVVIGDGSNLLFDDAGFRGIVIKVGRHLASVRFDDNRVTAEAGVWTPHFSRKVGNAGLGGVQHAIGIPGTLGGLLVMNGGSQRKGIGDNVVSVTCLDRNGDMVVLDKAACGFRYRTSTLQSSELVVIEAEFEFDRVEPSVARREMLEIMASRRKKFPLRLPNCGSVFLSDPAMYSIVGPPGRAIEESGLRGVRMGDAQIAPEHANFIVNLGRASSADVLSLIHLAKERVHARTGFWLRCEVRYLSPISGKMVPADEA